MSSDPQTLHQIRIAGLHALHDALGFVGMVRFLQQYETGSGDYTKDRHAWLDHWTLEDIRHDLEELGRRRRRNRRSAEDSTTPV